MNILQEITGKVLDTELKLSAIEKLLGKSSPEYQSVLSDFAKAWFMLRSSRNMNDFLT